MIAQPNQLARTAEILTKILLFSTFTVERLRELVGGSRVASFEANEAIVHHGAEATHFSVVLAMRTNAPEPPRGPSGSRLRCA